jgi:hypothetical protein
MKNFWLPEFDALAQYNAERSRGIMHTPEYIREMEILQKIYSDRIADFNAAQHRVHWTLRVGEWLKNLVGLRLRR